jgi:hypothetical protein
MIQKLILKLKQQTKLTEEEIDNGNWFCETCDCSISGLMNAVDHGLETRHQVFPMKVWDWSKRN